MKQLTILLMMLSIFGCSQKKETDRALITGVLNNVKDSISYIKYSYITAGTTIKDSAKVENEKYSLTVALTSPELIYFSPRKTNGQPISEDATRAIFIEPGAITINSNNRFENITVSGSKSNDEYIKFKKLEEPYTKLEDSAYKQYSAYYETLTTEQKRKEDDTNTLDVSEPFKKYTQFTDSIAYDRYHKVWFVYLTDHANSPIALYLVTEFAQTRNLMRSAPYFYKLPLDVQNSHDGKYLKNLYDRYEATGIGKMAPDFTSTDTSNKKVSLSDFRGKYVLLDFWANWCHWCRVESPFMNKAFKKYQSKNFAIISVSLDGKADESLWKKAIRDDHYIWTNVSDLKGFDSPLINAYGIISIPKNLLLDPTGKIIAKELRGEKLEETLHQLLDK